MPPLSADMLGSYLARYGWSKFMVQERPGRLFPLIHTGWANKENSQQFPLLIDPIGEMGLIRFLCSFGTGLGAGEPARLEGLRSYLLLRNYRELFVKWAQDVDGEITASLTYGIDEGLPFERFARLLTQIRNEVQTEAPILAGLASGGILVDDLLRPAPVAGAPVN